MGWQGCLEEMALEVAVKARVVWDGAVERGKGKTEATRGLESQDIPGNTVRGSRALTGGF